MSQLPMMFLKLFSVTSLRQDSFFYYNEYGTYIYIYRILHELSFNINFYETTLENDIKPVKVDLCNIEICSGYFTFITR